MSKVLKIIFSVIVWTAIAVYLVFAARRCSEEHQQQELTGVVVKVMDKGKADFITEENVERWLLEDRLVARDSLMAQLDTRALELAIALRPFVREARAYTDMTGTLHVDVWQRVPIARVKTEGGYDFYISDDEYILPAAGGGAVYVPVVTGRFSMPFGPGYGGSLSQLQDGGEKNPSPASLYLVKLINFVRFINADPFWNAQIVQINVREKQGQDASKEGYEPDIELIPRIGRHVVMMGSTDDAKEKLDNLALFYNKALDYEGWGAYRYIDLRFRNQVVCRR